MTLEAFTAAFEALRPQLRSYLIRVTASGQDTDDLLQDTYLKAADKLAQFRGDSSLKTWLFAIATNLARDNRRAIRRWTEDVTDLCREDALTNPQYFAEVAEIRATSPQAEFEIREHIAFCLTCIAKSLPLEQHLTLFLKEIYAFKVQEIAEILALSEAMVKYFLHQARSSMKRIFDGRCALINKEGTCHQCSELNGIFNPEQNTQEQLVRLDLVRQAESGNKDHLLDLRLKVVQDIDPFTSKGASLQMHHLENNLRFMENFLKKKVE